jgi:hypothetical protein
MAPGKKVAPMTGFLKSTLIALGLAPEPKPKPKAKAKTASPERKALLKEVMAARKGARKVLDDLPAEDRARLLAMAILAFGAEKEKGGDGGR